MQQVDTLVVVGCSHSFGAETISEEEHSHPDSVNYSYGKFLADKLNCKNYHNISFCGISNFEIVNRAIQFTLKENLNPDTTLFVVGWTDANRFTFFHKKIFNKFSLPQFLIKSAPTIFNQPYNFSSYMIKRFILNSNKNYFKYITGKPGGEEFLTFFDKYIFDTPYYYDLNYNSHLLLNDFFNNRGIKHITFPTISIKMYDNTFKYEKILNTKNNILEFNDKFSYLNNFKQYGTYKGGHPKIEAHKAFADFLYKELIKRQIL